MKTHRIVLIASMCALTLAHPLFGGELTKVVKTSHLTGGVIVLVNADSAIYEEAAASGCTVRGLETDQAAVDTLRGRFISTGIYGKVSVSGFDGKTLPCIDSLVNLVFVGEAHLDLEEVMRVLAPGGTALVKGKTGLETHIKPWPKEMDEWNQYLHGADNNGVASDSAGPPERLQWTGGSAFGRMKTTMPSVTSMVSAGGRIFTVEDMASTEAGTLPKRYVLLARDAFNGCELWRYSLKEWDKEAGVPVKDISVQLQRRVLAVGDKVYCTTGFDEPIAVFDGASGAILSTFEKSENTREFAYADGMIFGVKGASYAYRASTKQMRFEDVEIGDVTLYACEAESGKMAWQIPIEGADGYIGGTLSIKGKYLSYITRGKLFCRNSKSGEEIWKLEYPYLQDMPSKGVSLYKYNNFPPTLLMTDERLFCSDLDKIKAYALADGALLWSGSNLCNYTKNGDLFLADGLLWTGQLKGLDPATGELRRELTQKMTDPMSHDRCYRNRITDSYFINSKTGGADLIRLDGGGEFPSPWMRATCGLGITPSYGRLYSSPYICTCVIGNMLTGFNCTYTQSRDKGGVLAIQPKTRLIKGSAYGVTAGPPASSKKAWPTYRHDNARSGVTAGAVPEQLKVIWRASLPGRPTAPVVAGGLLLTAVRDMHTLFALDSRTGKRKWQFTADGPIDSPPTCHGRLVLFGSRDGWVYCLDAHSGALVWKFSDMPEIRLICDSEQLESAWPVNGSVMVREGLVYFAAGRSSFLDGGIVVYALHPETGEVKHRRSMAGPYDAEKFPLVNPRRNTRIEGFKSGIFSSEDDNLYIRHQGFKHDLSPINPEDIRKPHLLASPGFLSPVPEHRTYWTIDTDLCYGPANAVDGDGPQGDILAVDGKTFYEIRGYFVGRHAQPRADPLKMYHVFSGAESSVGERDKRRGRTKGAAGLTVPRTGDWEKRWSTDIPFAGHAILVAGETLVVAGVPMRADFMMGDIEASYQGKKGGVLWTLSTTDGKKKAELDLPAPPVWDGFAAADGFCYLPLKDGSVLCLGHRTDLYGSTGGSH